jgi:hypothetical protein
VSGFSSLAFGVSRFSRFSKFGDLPQVRGKNSFRTYKKEVILDIDEVESLLLIEEAAPEEAV